MVANAALSAPLAAGNVGALPLGDFQARMRTRSAQPSISAHEALASSSEFS